ncbi:S-layer homology domain-containing protein [Lysinibacillus sp. FSL H8-0500]|uniref:S-layer homology domain-containing protein n=1 Tax=Lysinibacillus sp. FSL H8-0500 TaxID=2921393 RepID=UPI003101388D
MRNILKVACLLVLLVIFLPKEAHAASFRDLTDETLATEIDYLVEQDIIEGYPNNIFKPNDHVTRAQVAIMLTRALGLNTVEIENPNYQDIPTTHKYYKEIAAVQNAGIFKAASNFEPNATLSRGEMAIVLQRAFQLKGNDPHYYFTDVTKQTPGYQAILAVAHNHIVKGYSDRSFKPNQPLTRAHFSAFLARAMTLAKPNLAKDRRFIYTYNYYSLGDHKRYTLNYKYDHFDGKNDVWTVTDANTGKRVYYELLYNGIDVYGEALVTDDDYASHYDLYIQTPLRIGVIEHENEPKVTMGSRITVKSTNDTVQAGEVQYTGAIVFEITSIYADGVTTCYYVDNVGLVKMLHNDKVVYELLDRTLK